MITEVLSYTTKLILLIEKNYESVLTLSYL